MDRTIAFDLQDGAGTIRVIGNIAGEPTEENQERLESLVGSVHLALMAKLGFLDALVLEKPAVPAYRFPVVVRHMQMDGGIFTFTYSGKLNRKVPPAELNEMLEGVADDAEASIIETRSLGLPSDSYSM